MMWNVDIWSDSKKSILEVIFHFQRYIILFVAFLTNVAEFIKQKSFYFEYIIEALLQFTCTICKMSILQLGTRF